MHRIDVTGFTSVTARLKKVLETVAKVSPGEFMRQVRAEASKVVWPTRRETLITAVMVLIMTSLLAVFFLGVDSVFSTIVQFLLKQIA
jgi:preprotein translocase subunit SecE